MRAAKTRDGKTANSAVVGHSNKTKTRGYQGLGADRGFRSPGANLHRDPPQSSDREEKKKGRTFASSSMHAVPQRKFDFSRLGRFRNDQARRGNARPCVPTGPETGSHGPGASAHVRRADGAGARADLVEERSFREAQRRDGPKGLGARSSVPRNPSLFVGNVLQQRGRTSNVGVRVQHNKVRAEDSSGQFSRGKGSRKGEGRGTAVIFPGRRAKATQRDPADDNPPHFRGHKGGVTRGTYAKKNKNRKKKKKKRVGRGKTYISKASPRVEESDWKKRAPFLYDGRFGNERSGPGCSIRRDVRVTVGRRGLKNKKKKN